MATEYKNVGDLSVKELKAELKAYGVDFVAAGCLEKKDMRNLLTKTRKEKGWPPKSNASSTPSSTKASSSTTSKAKSTKAQLPESLKVAVIFDPDVSDIRDASQFIQPFFLHTPEAVQGKGAVHVAWVMPIDLRDELIQFNLPEQLADFDWFQALFVGRDGQVVDFDNVKVPGLSGEAGESGVGAFARVAARWGADWWVVRRAGGVLGRRWLTQTLTAFKKGFRAAYVPGMLVLDPEWHQRNVTGVTEPAKAIMVPADVKPFGAWYYYLLEVYPEASVFQLDAAADEETDADKVMLACVDSIVEPMQKKLRKLIEK